MPGDVVRFDVVRNLHDELAENKTSNVEIQKRSFDLDFDMNFDMDLPRHGEFRAKTAAVFEIPISFQENSRLFGLWWYQISSRKFHSRHVLF